MGRKPKDKIEVKEEVSREVIDNDHVLIIFSDGTTETRVI